MREDGETCRKTGTNKERGGDSGETNRQNHRGIKLGKNTRKMSLQQSTGMQSHNCRAALYFVCLGNAAKSTFNSSLLELLSASWQRERREGWEATQKDGRGTNGWFLLFRRSTV